jgi:hypothetical protein
MDPYDTVFGLISISSNVRGTYTDIGGTTLHRLTHVVIPVGEAGLYNIQADDEACIIPSPVSWHDNGEIQTLCDSYTNIMEMSIKYLRKPHDITLNNQCELPEYLHKDIVEAAFALIIQEGVGTFAGVNKAKQQQQEQSNPQQQ